MFLWNDVTDKHQTNSGLMSRNNDKLNGYTLVYKYGFSFESSTQSSYRMTMISIYFYVNVRSCPISSQYFLFMTIFCNTSHYVMSNVKHTGRQTSYKMLLYYTTNLTVMIIFLMMMMMKIKTHQKQTASRPEIQIKNTIKCLLTTQRPPVAH